MEQTLQRMLAMPVLKCQRVGTSIHTCKYTEESRKRCTAQVAMGVWETVLCATFSEETTHSKAERGLEAIGIVLGLLKELGSAQGQGSPSQAILCSNRLPSGQLCREYLPVGREASSGLETRL